jgi:hypothetical protein
MFLCLREKSHAVDIGVIYALFTNKFYVLMVVELLVILCQNFGQ